MLKILTLNIRGLRNLVKRTAFFSYLKTMVFDICLVQEVHLKDERDVIQFTREWDRGDSRWNIGGVHSSGVGVLFGNRNFIVEKCVNVVPGRALYLDICSGENCFRCVCVYAPAMMALRADFFKELYPVCLTNKWIIMGGDFNVDLQDKRDPGAKQLNLLLAQFGLYDCAYRIRKEKAEATWRNAQGTVKRLDYVFASLDVPVEKVVVLPVGFSDHALVEAHFPHLRNQFGRGVWKLNTENLREDEYVKVMRYKLQTWWKERNLGTPLIDWWEHLKKKIRKETRIYGRARLKRERQKGRALQERLNTLFSQCNKDMSVCPEDIAAAKAELRTYHEQKARSYLFRAHVQFIQSHETCSSFFFRQIRQRQKRSVMTGIQTSEGKIVTSSEEMLEVVRHFYQCLFSLKTVDEAMGAKLLSGITAQVPVKAQEQLEAPISLQELGDALLGMKAGKVPGKDGLPAEFYRTFWDILGPILLQVTEEIFRRKAMCESMREGILTLLYKKGPAKDLKNWRPLQMLCVDYKLIAKVLVNRLKGVLAHVIGWDQTCGVRGRRASWTLQLVRDVIAWSENRNVPLLIASLDLEKAFDNVSHTFVWQVMEKMGFGPVMLGWLKILYSQVGSRVLVNGHLGGLVLQESGVRQGCPLSPLLFALYMEPYARAVQKEPSIDGILVPGSGGKRVKVALYADDVTLFLSSYLSLQAALDVFENFSLASGAKLNRGKSQIKFFGPWKEQLGPAHGLDICQGPLKILGVLFTAQDAAWCNWSQRLEKARLQLTHWKNKQLSFVGKVLILKVVFLPVLVYLASVYPMPARFNRYLVREVFMFMWGGKYEYVRRVDMYRPVEEGGRGVPNFPVKLNCIYVSGLCIALHSPVSHPFQYFVRFWLSSHVRALAQWSNSLPHGNDLPWHYRHATHWLKQHPELKDHQVLLNHRRLYSAVTQAEEASLVGGVPNVVWRRVQPRGLQHHLMDLNWLSAWGRLAVREVLFKHKLTKQQECPRAGCHAVESISHVFWDCNFAQRTWNKCETLFSSLSSTFCVLPAVVLYGLKVGGGANAKSFVLWLLVSLIKFELWNSRNLLVKRGIVCTVDGLYRRLLWNLRGLVEGDIKRWGFHAAKEKWKSIVDIWDWK